MNWRALLRDVVLLFLLTGVGGFLFGFFAAAGGTEPSIPLLAVINVGLMIVGFSISGSLTRIRRVWHLFAVATLTWVLSLVNLLFGTAPQEWLLSGIGVLFSCAVGGAISALLFRAAPGSPAP